MKQQHKYFGTNAGTLNMKLVFCWTKVLFSMFIMFLNVFLSVMLFDYYTWTLPPFGQALILFFKGFKGLRVFMAS